MHAWGDHLSPVLYLLVPLTWVAPGAIGLLVVQTLVLAAGGLAVFGYAARRLGAGPRRAGGLALLFLLNPSLHGINLRDIHPQAFAITLLVAAALAFDARRYAWCAVALALTLGVSRGRRDRGGRLRHLARRRARALEARRGGRRRRARSCWPSTSST